MGWRTAVCSGLRAVRFCELVAVDFPFSAPPFFWQVFVALLSFVGSRVSAPLSFCVRFFASSSSLWGCARRVLSISWVAPLFPSLLSRLVGGAARIGALVAVRGGDTRARPVFPRYPKFALRQAASTALSRVFGRGSAPRVFPTLSCVSPPSPEPSGR